MKVNVTSAIQALSGRTAGIVSPGGLAGPVTRASIAAIGGLAAFAAFAASAAGGSASATQDGSSFFADLRDAYSERSSYADLGEIEVTVEIDGIEDTRLHFFETVATRDGGLVLRVMKDSDRGFDDLAVWLAGDSVMIYDAGLREAKPSRSIAHALDEVLGPAGRALLVPTLLEFGLGSGTLDALATGATLGEPESCLDDHLCRILSAPLDAGGDTQIRLTVEVDTFWIHSVELVLRETDAGNGVLQDSPRDPTKYPPKDTIDPSGPRTTTVRVSHSPSAFDNVEARAEFAPPPTTQEVADWSNADTQDADLLRGAHGFYDEITIDVFTLVARIVTHAGYPLRDLEPGDLIATIGGQEVPVAAVDWYGSTEPDLGELADRPPPSEMEALSPETEPAPRLEPEGRLVVVFLQNDFEPTRVKGQMKLFPGLRRLIDNLGPSDRVAVLSYFAHLKLWQDFTTDREAVKASLNRAFFPGAKPGRVEPGTGLSLLDYFDQNAARDVANPVEALRFTSEALAPIPGEKDIIFFGYGLEGGREARMFRALQAAQATMFVLDTTQADFHTLGAGLKTMAAATGGTYASSYLFHGQALNKIGRTISGHYVITIDRTQFPEVRGKLEIRLRDKKGKVLMVPSELI